MYSLLFLTFFSFLIGFPVPNLVVGQGQAHKLLFGCLYGAQLAHTAVLAKEIEKGEGREGP